MTKTDVRLRCGNCGRCYVEEPNFCEACGYASFDRITMADGGETASVETLLFEAIAENFDEEQSGAPVGDVVQEVISEQSIDIADFGHALRELYFDGQLYQPSPTTICQTAQDVAVTVKCPDCEATHVRPRRFSPSNPPETIEGECYAPHPGRGADFEGCGEDVELDVVEVEVR